MTDNSPNYEESLRRINPIPPAEIEGLTSEAKTRTLLAKIHERSQGRRKVSMWRRFLARLGIGVMLLVGLVSVTASAEHFWGSKSNNPSSVACFAATSEALNGVEIPLGASPTTTCRQYWSSHSEPVRHVKTVSCVLSSGIVGVFASSKGSPNCASDHLVKFISYSSPDLVAFYRAVTSSVRSQVCPNTNQVLTDVNTSIQQFHLTGWVAQIDVQRSANSLGKCATFEFASKGLPRIQVLYPYVGQTLPRPPWTSTSRALWAAWSAAEAKAFRQTDWEKIFSNPLCRVTTFHVENVASAGVGGIPKGIGIQALSGVSSCSQ